MSKLKFLSPIALVVFLSGCFGGGTSLSQEEMDARLRLAYGNTNVVDMATGTVKFSGNFLSAAHSNAAGVKVEEQGVTFEGTVTSKQLFSGSEPKVLTAESTISGKGSYNKGEPSELSLSVKIFGKKLYFRLDKFPTITGEAGQFVNGIVTIFSGKWWYIELPQEITPDLFKSLAVNPIDTDPAKTAALQELIKNTDFTEKIVAKGSEKIEGLQSDKYVVTVDKAALFDFIVKVGELNAQVMEQKDKDSLKEFLDATTIEFSVWISQEGDLITKTSFNFSVDSEIETEPVAITMTGESVANYKDDVKIEEPTDATKFDLNSLGIPMGI